MKPICVGYSGTVWDDGHSGVGVYLAEHVALLAHRADLKLRLIECGGRVMAGDARPARTSTGKGIARFFGPVWDIVWHRLRLPRLAAREGFDLVHVPTLRRLPGPTPCPAVVTVHDLGPIRFQGKYGYLRQVYHRRIVPRWLRTVSAVVTPSSATRDDLTAFYPYDKTRVFVVPNGVNHELYFPGESQESAALIARRYRVRPPYFLYISRLEHPAKNHVRLIEAFQEFKARTRLPHTLVLAGGPWHGHERVEQTAAAAVQRGDILLTGYVPREDLPHLLRAAESLVYPSLFEGFGLPVLEAMACGVPVACSRCSSLTEIAQGHALLFDPEDTEAMAAVLARLATDPDLRHQLRADGLVHAGRYTWARSVEETVAVWRQVLHK